MGEEAKQQEAKTEEKKENKAEEKTEENKAEEKTEEKKEESPEEKKEEPKPPSPVVLFVDLHCVGCAKKIERSIMKVRGVEEVAMDMSKNQITIKGIVEPQALCKRIQKKTKRGPKILSPLPSAEGDPLPQVVTSQVSAVTTVELNVNMHCEACAEQLKRKILKMRGVQMAETELASGKVKVTGTMDANRLVDYVYRRTKKQARIVPQPEEPVPVPVPVTVTEKKEDSKAEEKPAEETAEKKMDDNAKENPEKKGEDKGAEAEAKKGEEEEGSNKGESEGKKEDGNENKDEKEKENEANNAVDAEDIMRRRMFQYYSYYPPLYVIERVPPPQLFSDENPNACCIS